MEEVRQRATDKSARFLIRFSTRSRSRCALGLRPTDYNSILSVNGYQPSEGKECFLEEVSDLPDRDYALSYFPTDILHILNVFYEKPLTSSNKLLYRKYIILLRLLMKSNIMQNLLHRILLIISCSNYTLPHEYVSTTLPSQLPFRFQIMTY